MAGSGLPSSGARLRQERTRGRHRRPRALLPAGAGTNSPAASPQSNKRNVPTAVAVGLAMGTIAFAPLATYRPAFVVVMLAGIAIAVWELATAMSQAGFHAPLPPLLVGAVGSIGATWFAGVEAAVLGLLFTLVAVILWRLPDGPVGFGRDVTAAALIALYVPFLACFVVLLLLPEDGSWRVLAFLAVVVCSDVGGYAVGSLIGRHRLAPLLSPGKSWEGFAGSLAACALCGIAFLVFVFKETWWQGALFGMAIAIAATIGDLAESLLKRDLNVKDMSTLLPAHGGLMDRFDSLLAAAPVAYLLLTLFTPAN